MRPSDFGAFFRELHGYEPFPWQSRLAEELCTTNRWPDVIDVPTGSGKTACIDVALFHWLACAHAERVHDSARRIAFVVDRRIIVDEAALRARAIKEKLEAASTPLLLQARALLERLTSAKTIDVITLRGGVERERNVARDPTIVTIVLSTVDQIGSRLLFRGYGVSDRMKPIHAGIFGFDTHVLLDEAHIAEPFKQTLHGITVNQARAENGTIGPKPIGWTELSATPQNPRKDIRVFKLDDNDRAHPVLARRLNAGKPMRLEEVAKRDDLMKRLVSIAQAELDLLEREPLSVEEKPRIGIIVNRVASARAIFDELEKKLANRAEVELVIGRVRPLDRDTRMASLAPKLKAQATPRDGEKPIVVVATQTLEVGADFDFHSLLVEAASYSAIKQRVGRLNRLGTRERARGAIVLVRSDADDDPVYGASIGKTWALLTRCAREGVVDLGIAKAPPATEGTSPAAREAPFLSPSLLQLLVQTCPRPAVEPDAGELLHGFSRELADVSVVWRDGLTSRGDHDAFDESLARAVLDALPPLSLEAMSLPFVAFRQWAQTWASAKPSKIQDTGDVEGQVQLTDEDKLGPTLEVLLIKGDRTTRELATKIRPGATIVLPTRRGGVDGFGFAPDRRDVTVTDLSLQARSRRHSATIVWTLQLAQTWFDGRDEERAAFEDRASSLDEVITDEEKSNIDAFEAVARWFRDERERSLLRADVLAAFDSVCIRTGRNRSARQFARWEPLDVEGARRGIVLRADKLTGEDLVETDGGLQRTVDVPLAEHSRGVRDFAERFAKQVNLAEPLRSALRTAGYAHDLGKADPRFQARLGASPGELLAKSGRYNGRVEVGERHEVYSVALLDQHPELLADHDEHRDLIRYLIGTHHGFGRGFQPVKDDRGTMFEVEHDGRKLSYAGKPGLGGLVSGWTDLFANLHHRYGAWGLAYLEALLRLADHRRSELEMEDV